MDGRCKGQKIRFVDFLFGFAIGSCQGAIMVNDAELLRRYAAAHDEAAFGALVQRHLKLVYSVALRQVGGDAHLAQDVAQRVFADLARKAPELAGRATLGGWLYRAAQFQASDLVRAERARRAREQEAQLMQEMSHDPTAAAEWEKLRPVLDVAINELSENERDAVVLRFFETRPFAEIGAVLRVTEDAARMRVERALEKLRRALARRGVTSTSTALATVLANQAGIAAPAGLAASITGAAVAGAGSAGAAAIFMGMTKIQIGLAGALAVAFTTVYVVQGNAQAALRREIAALASPPDAAAALRAENQQLARSTAEVEMLRRDDLELKQIEQRVADAKQASEQRARVAQTRTDDTRRQFYDRVRADDARAQQEIERMSEEVRVLIGEYQALGRKSKDTTLTPEERAQAEAAMQAKLEVVKPKQQEIRAFSRNVRESLRQRVEAFRRINGDDPNIPPPQFQTGANRVEGDQVPADDANQAPGAAIAPWFLRETLPPVNSNPP
jgi:RNA polymerase sigma factor (sigma-70 family)